MQLHGLMTWVDWTIAFSIAWSLPIELRASHASHILDMEVADGRLLLMELIELATWLGATYRHEWRVGDLVMWDNRRSMHRGLPVRRAITPRPAACDDVGRHRTSAGARRAVKVTRLPRTAVRRGASEPLKSTAEAQLHCRKSCIVKNRVTASGKFADF